MTVSRMRTFSDAPYAMNVLKAIEALGTTHVELPNGKTAEMLPGRERVNRELVRQRLAAAGSPDQWKRARPVLEGLGLVEYVRSVGSFLRVRDVVNAMQAVQARMPSRRMRPRKQAMPRVAALWS